jgi:hypothetical protein
MLALTYATAVDHVLPPSKGNFTGTTRMNDDYQTRARELQLMIQASQQINALHEILRSLTDLADLMIEAGKKTEAANLLAYVMRHPDIRYDTFDRAEDLFLELEAELCPRVIEDAKTEARYITMRGAIESAFAAL